MKITYFLMAFMSVTFAINANVQNAELTLSEKGNVNITSEQQQKETVTGIVVDAEGEPVIGASVVEKDVLTNGTITDVDGKFSFSVDRGSICEVSYIGYKTQTFKAISGKIITVTLEENLEALDEVVVVGYGKQKVATVTGSVAQIKTEKITVAPMQNTTHALAGQLPGLVTKQTSGMPGQDNAAFYIRGFDNPLVIIDGIEGSLNLLDANQIESISMLKDGAASIYGARAGNGVILVTTKRGSNTKPIVNFNASYTLQGSIVTTLPASSYQRAQYKNDIWRNTGEDVSKMPYSDHDLEMYKAGTEEGYLNTDWYHAAIRDYAPQQNYNVSASGGTDKIKYYGYFGYNTQETLFKKNGGHYDRYNFQTNFSAKVTDQITISMDLQYMKDQRYYPSGADIFQDGTNFWRDLIYPANPIYPATLPNSNYESYADVTYGNPVWATDAEKSGYYDLRDNNIRFNGEIKYDLNKYLTGFYVKGNVLYSNNDQNLKWIKKQGKFYTYNSGADEYTFMRSSQDPTSMQMNYGNSWNLVQQYSLNFDRDFNGHNISALAMYEYNLQKNRNFNTARSGFKTLIIEEFASGDATTASNSSSSSAYGRTSWIGRLNYNYKYKYMVEAIFRADASSRFADGYRWGYFPSISAGWNIANEKFMDSVKWIDNLKLRASYGSSGYDAVASFNYLTGYSYDKTYTIGSTLYNGLISTGLANELLTWEKMKIYNVGLDFSLYNRKIYGEFDAFLRNRTGIPGYRSSSLPNTFGATLPQENLNATRTTGFEFKVGTTGTVGELTYDVNANIAYYRTKWTKYDQADYTDEDQIRLYKKEGQYTDATFGYETDGLFASQEEIDKWPCTIEALNNDNSYLKPGDIKYVDKNGDGIINWRDQVEIGKGSFPHWNAGLNANLAWRNFDLSLLFQGAWDYTTAISYTTNSETYCDLYYDEVRNADPKALVPRAGGASSNGLTSDFSIHNTAYVRLKNAAIGYNIPSLFMNKIGISKFRVYIGGTNLFTISTLHKYGVDPEISGSNNAGVGYPQQYTLSAGCNIVF